VAERRWDRKLTVAGELDADAVKQIQRRLHPLPMCWWCCFVAMARRDWCIYSRARASHCPAGAASGEGQHRAVAFDAGPAAAPLGFRGGRAARVLGSRGRWCGR
jgi:hypothetical protein